MIHLSQNEMLSENIERCVSSGYTKLFFPLFLKNSSENMNKTDILLLTRQIFYNMICCF